MGAMTGFRGRDGSVSGEAVRQTLAYNIERGYPIIRFDDASGEGCWTITPGWVQTRGGLIDVGAGGEVRLAMSGVTLQTPGDERLRRFAWEDVVGFPATWSLSAQARVRLRDFAEENGLVGWSDEALDREFWDRARRDVEAQEQVQRLETEARRQVEADDAAAQS
jgi:hypothetical protein